MGLPLFFHETPGPVIAIPVATDASNAFLDILRRCAPSIKKLAIAVNLYPALDGLCTVMDGWLLRLQSFPAGGDLTVRPCPLTVQRQIPNRTRQVPTADTRHSGQKATLKLITCKESFM
jgi:hypothetical protein